MRVGGSGVSMVILSLAFSLFSAVPCRLLSPLPSPYRYLVRGEGSRERNQALLSMRPREASPHQTKRARPHCASLGIFNTAGYKVLIALFLTSQIPFLSLFFSSSALSIFFTLSLFLPSNLLCPNFLFSSLSRRTFVLSFPFLKSVTSCALLTVSFFLYASLAVCHIRGDTLGGNHFCVSFNTS